MSGPDATHPQRFQATEHDALAEPRALVDEADPREPLEQHLEHDPAFQARERCPEAMVGAPPERHVRHLAASDIETVRILEH